ncbi:MAG: flagellar assembly protein T N-terminal domain-containing protein [Candidatus Zhuqueibacterota bacterium]
MKQSAKIITGALVALLAFSLFSISGIAQQTTMMVTSQGVATIFGNDKALARDQAIDDALRNAVEQSLGTFVQSSTLVENAMVVEDNILTWSNGYVRKYTVAREAQTGEATYEVTVDAELEMSNLKNDWESVQNLLSRMGNPRVMFMMDEQNIGHSYDRYHFLSVDMTISENTLLNKFIENGFECVDPATVRQNLEQDQALAILQGNNQMAAAIAKTLGAEVIVTGKAIAKVATGVNLGGMKSCQANVTARVIKADVATVIATGSQHAAYPHIDEITGGTEAIKKATDKMATELINKITKKWRDEFYQATTVKVVVQGVQSFSQLDEFKNTIKYMVRGVKDIYSRKVAGDLAELDIKITGNANQLARELEKKDLEKYSVKILGLSMNKITLQLSNKIE